MEENKDWCYDFGNKKWDLLFKVGEVQQRRGLEAHACSELVGMG